MMILTRQPDSIVPIQTEGACSAVAIQNRVLVVRDCLSILLARPSEVVLDEQGVALRFETFCLFERGGHRGGELRDA